VKKPRSGTNMQLASFACTRSGISEMNTEAASTPSGIADALKQLRNMAGLTQAALAKRAGVGLRFVREVEQGKVTVRMDKVNQVLALFGYHLEAVKDS
jgi:y4mF family transcriptional regulator